MQNEAKKISMEDNKGNKGNKHRELKQQLNKIQVRKKGLKRKERT